MKIINLTQHTATAEQRALGVFDSASRDDVLNLISFEWIPSKADMWTRASALAAIAVKENADAAMLGGAPFFMRPLEEVLEGVGIKPLYAFSKRISEEKALPDGGVVKTSRFVFEGFVE